MKRILHIVGAMAPGGFENFIMNIYRRLDRSQVQFDFIVHGKKDNAYDEEIEAMGGKLYYVTRKGKNPAKNFMEIRRVVRDNQYNIVCRHSDNAFTVVDLLAARMGGAKEAIMHSHSTTTGHKGIHAFFRNWMGIVPTRCFACSQEAGRWMFGKRDFLFVPNAIDTTEFSFDEGMRKKMRSRWKVEEAHVYGHVGNFVYAKNHDFLLDVFHKISESDNQAVLFLVGDGELREEIEKKIKRAGLEDRVILTGRRKDVVCFLQMFDLLLFPSIYEGLPVSLVEAQNTGLPCLISERITEEILLTDCVRRKALEDGALAWAGEAISYLQESSSVRRYSRGEEIKAAGYGIDSLVDFYRKL
ncbi:MAG: glycosyltransferase family 1 protein [Lachnospiraceae bacterium]